MYIDTTSRAAMESSISNYFDIPIDEIYQLIDYAAEKAQQNQFAFNTDVFYAELKTIFSDLNPQDTIDEILLFHLTRRLDGDNNSGDNLRHLLTTQSPLSCYLRTYGFEFKDDIDRITLYYRGKQINLKNTMNNDVCCLRSRLGYSDIQKDYCFNGFAMRDLLMRNSYARELYEGPELIIKLASLFKNTNIQKDFFEKSKYYCYKYRLPISIIVFDDKESLADSEKSEYLLYQVCSRLLAYQYSRYEHMDDYDNPILRLNDNYTIPTKYFESKEEITLEMLF